jgi:hypothetical protein
MASTRPTGHDHGHYVHVPTRTAWAETPGPPKRVAPCGDEPTSGEETSDERPLLARDSARSQARPWTPYATSDNAPRLSGLRGTEACRLAGCREPIFRPPALPIPREGGHAGTATRIGVIQQRALDGRRGSFHALAVVRADDRFHGFRGVSPAIASVTSRSRRLSRGGTLRVTAFASAGARARAIAMPRAQESRRARRDDCIAREMRKSNRARSTSDAALLLV